MRHAAPLMTLIPYVSRPADGRGLSARPKPSGIPEVMCRLFGKGRVVYFPVGHRPHVLGSAVAGPWPAAGNAVRWASAEPQP